MKNDKEVRKAVVSLLAAKGYAVSDLPGGQGARELSRVSIAGDGKTFVCAIKTSTSGRISFVREANGTFKVLDDVDLVIHAHPLTTDESTVVVSMFDAATVRKAFERNHKALTDKKMGHIPSWVNPEPEAGWRQTGSGFRDKALWRETVKLSSAEASRESHFAWGAGDVEFAPEHSAVRPLTIKEAKDGLAEMFGVSPDKVEITIKG